MSERAESRVQGVEFRDPRRTTMAERDLLAELHDEQCAHGATMGQLDAAIELIRELRANHRRPFGGWAPYDLPARVDDFLALAGAQAAPTADRPFGCDLCGAAPGDPCDCFDSQLGCDCPDPQA